MGIRTVMITGDNPRTAAAIAARPASTTSSPRRRPRRRCALIQEEQAKGKLVAMTGDGTNDAPALAQADVGVAMNTGTQAAKEAGNMVDLDSNPTKLLEVVEVGKQLLMTRGTLTTFSIANDVAKYFAILPALFVGVYPGDRAAQRHAPRVAAERHPLGGHLQRDHHRAAHPARAEGRRATGRSGPPRCCGDRCSSTALAGSSRRSSASSSSTSGSPPWASSRGTSCVRTSPKRASRSPPRRGMRRG